LTTSLQRAWQTLTAGAPRRPLREMAILTMPRTGSSYFCDCLATLPGVAMVREIFNPRGYGPVIKMDGARRQFEQILEREIAGSADSELYRYFVDHPVDVIETLAATVAAEERASLMVYKIISHQLDPAKLKAVLTQRRPIVVLLARQRLDVRISAVKAQSIGKWHHTDTKDVKVEIDVDQFLAWTRWADSWYSRVLEVTAELGLTATILDYDRDVDRPAAELRAKTAQLLKDLGVRLPRFGGKKLRIRERQDARTDPFSKISNGNALREELIARNMLDYALTSPLADRLDNNRID
jgi:hypothetical protein